MGLIVLIPEQKERYNDYIKRIQNERTNIKDENNYQELHHILPKCSGGDNDKENLIWLYPVEHYYAHKLLALENPDISGLQLAWFNMCHCSQNGERKYLVSAEEYAEARCRFSKVMQESMKGSNNPMYGTHHSEKEKENLRNKLKGRKNGPMKEETKKKLSEAKKGKSVGPMSQETKEKLSRANSGKKRTLEQRKVLSERVKNNPKLRNRLADYWKNRDRSGLNNPNYGKRFESNPNSIPVICLNTLQVYSCAKEAGIINGVSGTNITACIKGRQKTAGKDKEGYGLRWMYYSDFISLKGDMVDYGSDTQLNIL